MTSNSEKFSFCQEEDEKRMEEEVISKRILAAASTEIDWLSVPDSYYEIVATGNDQGRNVRTVLYW